MKILMMHRGGLGGIRGTEVCLIQAAQALHAAGHTILFARNLPVIDDAMAPYVDGIIKIDPEVFHISKFRASLPFVAYAQLFLRLHRLVKQFRPDVLYVSGGMLCQYAVPLGRLHKIPVLCHFHHPVTRPYYRNWLVGHADQHIVPSKFTQSDLLRNTGKTGVIAYNGIDTNTFTPVMQRDPSWRALYGIPTEAVVLGQVGQLVQHKRPDLLLRAFYEAQQQIPTLHLCLVGKGPMLDTLQAQALALGIAPKVTLTGFVESVTPFYQHVFDINALVSSEEGLGISVLEASACSLPSIVTDCTGLSETIIDEETGLYIPLEGQSELVNHIVELASNPILRASMGDQSRVHIIQNFSLFNYQQTIINTVESCHTHGAP